MKQRRPDNSMMIDVLGRRPASFESGFKTLLQQLQEKRKMDNQRSIYRAIGA